MNEEWIEQYGLNIYSGKFACPIYNLKYQYNLLLYIFLSILGGLECDGHFFAYVAHFVFLDMSGFEPRELP